MIEIKDKQGSVRFRFDDEDELRMWSFEEDCRNVDFRNLDLSECDFRGCDIEGADFRGANLENADFSNCDLESAIFDEDFSYGYSSRAHCF